MIVLDAGVLIAHFDPSDVFHVAAVGLLEEFEELDFATSAVTVAECLVRPTRQGQAHGLLSGLDQLLLLRLELTGADALGLAEVRAASGLRMPDAIVLYSAERHGAELATTDRALAAAAEARRVRAHLLELV